MLRLRTRNFIYLKLSLDFICIKRTSHLCKMITQHQQTREVLMKYTTQKKAQVPGTCWQLYLVCIETIIVI